jgi:hypothetical protein
MKFVSNETFCSDHNDIDPRDATEEVAYTDPSMIPTQRSSKTQNSEKLGWYEKIHARYAPIRRLKHRFFEDQILVRNFLVLCLSSVMK